MLWVGEEGCESEVQEVNPSSSQRKVGLIRPNASCLFGPVEGAEPRGSCVSRGERAQRALRPAVGKRSVVSHGRGGNALVQTGAGGRGSRASWATNAAVDLQVHIHSFARAATYQSDFPAHSVLIAELRAELLDGACFGRKPGLCYQNRLSNASNVYSYLALL